MNESPLVVGYTESKCSIESDGRDERLHIDYALISDSTRKFILFRRALSVLAAEEKRVLQLTDKQALDEYDALKAQADGQLIRQVIEEQS